MKKQVVIKLEKLVEIVNGTLTSNKTLVKSWLSEDHKLVISMVWHQVGHFAELILTPVIRVGLKFYVSPDVRVNLGSAKYRNPLDAEKWVRGLMSELYYSDAEGINGYMLNWHDERIVPVFTKRMPNGILKVKTLVGGRVENAFAIDTRKVFVGKYAKYAHEYNPNHSGDLVKLVDIKDYSYELL